MSQVEHPERRTLRDPDGSKGRELMQLLLDDLQRTKERWDRLCPGVDPVINEFASTTGAQPESWLERTPSRFLTWADGEYNHSISMKLPSEGESLDVWTATWQDNIDLGRRTTYTLHERLETPALEEPLRTCLGDMLVALNTIIENPQTVLSGGPLPRENQELSITVSTLPSVPQFI